jgi:hypothetical protein
LGRGHSLKKKQYISAKKNQYQCGRVGVYIILKKQNKTKLKEKGVEES